MKNNMRSVLVLSISLCAAMASLPVIADPASCLSGCKSDRLLCDRKDGHGLQCGHQERACEDGCAGKPKTSPVASCEQRCEDSGQQCGIANDDAQSCRNGRDTCLSRCKKH